MGALRWVLITCALYACDREQSVLAEDIGKVCVFAGDVPVGYMQSFVVGAPATVNLGNLPCSACDKDQQGSCTVTLEGTTLRITTQASWTDVTQPADSCSNDPCSLAATCPIAALDAGTYTLAFGPTQTLYLAVPSDVPTPPCLMHY